MLDRKNALIAALTMLVIALAAAVVYMTITVRISAKGTIKSVGIDVYGDQNLTRSVEYVD